MAGPERRPWTLLLLQRAVLSVGALFVGQTVSRVSEQAPWTVGGWAAQGVNSVLSLREGLWPLVFTKAARCQFWQSRRSLARTLPYKQASVAPLSKLQSYPLLTWVPQTGGEGGAEAAPQSLGSKDSPPPAHSHHLGRCQWKVCHLWGS